MKRSILAVCTGSLLLAGTAAIADTSRNDAGNAAPAKLAMESAVSIAEKHANGKAVRAEYEKQKDGTWVYDVEVRTGDTVMDVRVDADKGTVLASKADTNDDDDDGDKAD